MPRATKANIRKPASQSRSTVKFFVAGNFDELLREVGALSVLALAAYLFICLISWSPGDPGHSYTGSGEAIANWGGRVGAWFADMMFTLFGRMAYLLLLLCATAGWRAFGNRPNAAARSKAVGRGRFQSASRNAANHQSKIGVAGMLPVIGFVLAMTGGCGLEQIYFPYAQVSSAFRAGGILGAETAKVFIGNFGVVGATVILLALLMTGITLISHVSWFNVMDRLGYQVFGIIERAKAGFEAIADRNKGAQVRRERQVNVKRMTAIAAQKPPRIEPKFHAIDELKLPPKQQQLNLFADGASGALPSLSLLETPERVSGGYSKDALQAMSQLLVKKLKDFNVDVTVEAVQPGPVITRFEIEPVPGIKASQIVGLGKDLARSLTVDSVRVVENIPGKNLIGIEIPNRNREIVRLVEGLASPEFENSDSPLTLVLGKDIAGKPVTADLMKMPHILIAGTTGAGKSVCINALILSLVYKSTPQDVRLIMVDPKFLELSVYDGIPHLLAPVVTDMNKAANALRWCIVEMDRRFRIMADVGVRNISGYNKKIDAANKAGEPLVDNSVEAGQDNPVYLSRSPFIVVIVDELADLMMVVGKKIEEIITRIAQRARAAGIHLVLATQRPSVDVVTGLIKANVPTRIAFQVSSRVDSRTVLDQMGAETLLGQGDMLYLPPGTGFSQRVHGSFVSDEEVATVVRALKNSGSPVYVDAVTNSVSGGEEAGNHADGEAEADPLYDEAVRFVTQSRKASISSVQRVLRVGYNRAARMIETMEATGVITPSENGKREVIAPIVAED